MDDLAETLEQLEMVMGLAQEDEISQLSDTVHYNPSDLSKWVQSMLSDSPPVRLSPNYPEPPTNPTEDAVDFAQQPKLVDLEDWLNGSELAGGGHLQPPPHSHLPLVPAAIITNQVLKSFLDVKARRFRRTSELSSEDLPTLDRPTRANSRRPSDEQSSVHGDLNEILASIKKKRGPARPVRHILAFWATLMDCRLLDLGFSGCPFTWKTTHGGGIKERLDWFCATASWQNLFQDANVTHFKFRKSDHISILLEANIANLKRYHCPFIFEEMWTRHEDCEEVIPRAWNVDIADYPMFRVCKKIKATRLALLKWQHSTLKAH
ncbi:hypothetical protein ACFX2J_034237 [Malus domestica]